MTVFRVIAHTFTVNGDIDDPSLYAAEPLHKWKISEAGEWMLANSDPPVQWHESLDHTTFDYRYYITGYLTEKQLTFWKLKYA